MTRYQQDMELKRKECKERFGCTQSGNCTHCGKYIEMDLGKQIAFCHLELAQLWRCPVMWCTVWKGTAQDSIDHMRRIHKLPLSAWTVSRVEWSKMLMPCVSGVAIDTLLFSHVGSPLCHRYRLISRTGSHTAFRGTYLRRLWSFIEEMDSAGRRQGPRGLSRRVKGSVSESQGFRLSERPSAEMSSLQALMELALPIFTMAEGTQGKHSPWPVAKEAPASPSPNRSDPRWSSKQQVLHSVYFDLNALASSSDDELVDVRKCKDLSVTVLYKPEEDDTPAKSGMAASDMTQPMRPRSRHELSAPTVDLVTGKCKPGKMIRTFSASPLTVDMTVSCKPEPDSVQQGVNADVLPPPDSVGMSAADVNTSTPVVTAPGLGEVMVDLL